MKYLLVVIGLMIYIIGFTQQVLPDYLVKNIQARIENEYSPSIAVGIIDADGLRYYCFGNTTNGGTPVNEHTIYEIGSISKTFTAILLAQMVLDGKMKLDDPAQKHLPEAVHLPTWEGHPITLGHLSDHTSSLPRMPTNFDPADLTNPYADYTVEQMYTFLSSCELSRKIGSEYEYSNLAQGLLGHILALKAGKTYEDLIRETIAGPLDMQETKIVFDENMRQHLAPGHSHGAMVPNWDFTTMAGAGAIRSSLHDMLLYIAANIGLKETKLYPAIQLTHQVRHDKAGQARVGLAWHISNGTDGDVVWHNGGTGGYRTFAGFVKETGKGVVVLTNSTKGADDIGFHLLNPDTKLIAPKVSVATLIRKAVDADGPQAAMAAYQELKTKDEDDYEWNEMGINNLGYTYLQENNIPAALAIFKVNVEAFPASYNVYDSYGEALMKDGQQEAAIENYQKSLALNPGNTNAREMLTKMGLDMTIKEIKIDESVLETYVGTYELAPGFNITVTRSGTQLFAEATGQGQFELFAKSPTEFFLKTIDAQLTFSVKDSQVEGLILYQGGQILPGKKVK